MATTATELAALRATVEASMQAAERDRLEAKEQRESMAHDIAAIRSDASSIQNRVTNLEADMSNVKPVIAKVNGWQSMVMGAAVVLGLIGSAVTLFWGVARDKIIAMFGL